MYLIDTDVLSALRRPDRNPAVARWYGERQAPDFYVSVITIGEIQRGASRAASFDTEFADILTEWLHKALGMFDGRILGIDLAVARRWGQLSAVVGNRNPDLLIAATALERDLTVVTRNVRHFEPAGVRIVNPFEAQR